MKTIEYTLTSFFKRTLLPTVFFVLMVPIFATVAASDILSFDLLKQRLIQEGFDADHIDKIYDNPRVFFEVDGVSRYFKHVESRVNYEQFLTKRSIKKAKNYMEKFNTELNQTEKIFGVDKEIITAILLVETHLGSYLGKKSIINTLSTLAALSDADLRETFWNKIPPDRRFTKFEYEKKAREKSSWAYSELKAFLTYSQKEGFDPAETKGSFAGAMGIAQFMPSNILTLAIDGDKDGRIDLFSHPDAIMSIGNYLKHHHYRMGMDREKAFRVLLSYNYSKPYADTLLEISDRLKNNN